MDTHRATTAAAYHRSSMVFESTHQSAGRAARAVALAEHAVGAEVLLRNLDTTAHEQQQGSLSARVGWKAAADGGWPVDSVERRVATSER